MIQSEWTQYTEFLEQGCDAALFVGMHAMAGTPDGVMSHTVSGQAWQSLTFNGTLVGETGINAALCGHWGCPCCSSPATARRAGRRRRSLGDGLTTVEVKVGIGRYSARSLPALQGARGDRGRREARAAGSEGRAAVRPGPPVRDRGRVHDARPARGVPQPPRRRGHGTHTIVSRGDDWWTPGRQFYF